MPLTQGMRLRAYARRAGVRRYQARRKKYGLRRRLLTNPTPTFVETANLGVTFANVGGVFSVSVNDIAQVAQYSALYKQYRINWAQIMLIPDYNTGAADNNAAQYNATIPTGNVGMARIAWAVNDSPQLVAPATEAALLEDNGAKIRPLQTMWKQSFKPVPDVAVTSGGNQLVWTKQKYRQWFNFGAQANQNPLFYGISYFITQPVAGLAPQYHVYCKINFSLRDPQ